MSEKEESQVDAGAKDTRNTVESDDAKTAESTTMKRTAEKQAKAQSPKQLSPIQSSVLNLLTKITKRVEEKAEKTSEKPKKTTKKKSVKKARSKKSLNEEKDVSSEARILAEEKDREDIQCEKTLVGSSISKSRKSSASQSLGKKSKGKEKKQTKISDFFPVRKSSRKCKSAQEKEENVKITNAILSRQEEGLEVRQIEDKGRSVFATQPFGKNDFVCEYAGELISRDEAKKREETYTSTAGIGCYMYYLEWKNKKYCVDATEENGTFGRLLNHSRSGNCRTRVHVINDTPHLILVAKRDVEKGEELTYDYGDRSKQSIESHPWLKY